MNAYLITLMSAAFLQGLFGSVHCVGMCGPFAILINRAKPKNFWANFFYNASRLISYSIFGAIFGVIGRTMDLSLAASISGVIGAGLLLLLGLSWIAPNLGISVRTVIPAQVTEKLTGMINRLENNPLLPPALGILSGLLPCGLLYPAYSLSLTAGSAFEGSLTMAAFSLGTWPALWASGWFSGVIFTRLREKKWKMILGIFIILTALGVIFHRFDHASHDHAIDENCTIDASTMNDGAKTAEPIENNNEF